VYNCAPARNREYTFGHKSFSVEKVRDPNSARQPPFFDFLNMNFVMFKKHKICASQNFVPPRGREPLQARPHKRYL